MNVLGILRIGIYARANIDAGDEITFDYKYFVLLTFPH